MKVWEFEDKVWEIEGIRIVIRAASDEDVSNYTFKNSAQAGWRVTQFVEKKIQPRIGDNEVIIIQGDGEQPHGRVILRTVRRTYS